MIVFEDRLLELIGLLPNINGFLINFYWAKNQTQVNQYLKLKKQPYPLIILVSGPEEHDYPEANEITRDSRFIIATREDDLTKLNDVRWESSYKNVLNPLAENFLRALEVSTISRLHEGFKLERMPNYADADKNNQIDIWDTVVIDCTVSINNNCLKPIRWE